jgi:hypothetical protein
MRRASGAFVFTGTALLLVIPAVILAATFTTMAMLGDEGTLNALRLDRIYYTAESIQDDWATVAGQVVTVHGDDNATIQGTLRSSWAVNMEDNSFDRFGVNVSIEEGKLQAIRVNASGVLYINFTGAPFNVSDREGNVLFQGALRPLFLAVGGQGAISTDETPPGAPGNLDPCSWSPKETAPVNLSWDAATDPESGILQYRVQIAEDDDTDAFGNFVEDVIMEANYTTDTFLVVDIPPFEDNKKYYWHVKAQDGAGNWGIWSDTCKVRPED